MDEICRQRRKTLNVKAGSVMIGCDSPISIQTMWKKPLSGIDDTLIHDVNSLESAGCDLLRFAVPDENSARLLGELSEKTYMPLIADIHFNHKLALQCLDYPIAKIRINPGNIGHEGKVKEVLVKAMETNTPIRIGINSGSLPAGLKQEKDIASAMLKACERELEILDSLGFSNAVFSLKASDVLDTIRANRLFAEKYPYPLHLGVTEAGPLVQGVVKSAVAMAELLKDGIGDTIRVSLSSNPLDEIIAGKTILQIMGRRTSGIKLISCPTCGRADFDVEGFLEQSRDYFSTVTKDITVAVMGCPVNGPGEARHADIGITGAGKEVVVFKKGELFKKTNFKEGLEIIKEEIEKF